jgi:hypothetical protein
MMAKHKAHELVPRLHHFDRENKTLEMIDCCALVAFLLTY